MASEVVIIGGGVAGLSAAHELVRRNYSVRVFERELVPGGKARSFPAKHNASESVQGLPSEHGFRLFPGFYRHIRDTFSEIPLPGGGSVLDNLIEVPHAWMASIDGASAEFPNTVRPRTPGEFQDYTAQVNEGLQLSSGDLFYFFLKIWQFAASCDARRMAEYEKIGWWEYIDAANQTAHFRDTIGSLVRPLVAADPRKASTRTMGTIVLQMFLSHMSLGEGVDGADYVLNGPTNDVWIDPWVEYLKGLGVEFNVGCQAEGFEVDKKTELIEAARVRFPDGKLRRIKGDHFIGCVPVEVINSLINDDMRKIDPSLAALGTLQKHTEWMTGVQFYLKRPPRKFSGHTIFLKTPWALTAVMQVGLWRKGDVPQWLNGRDDVREIISVCVSDWNRTGKFIKKKARDCSAEEIAEEVWKNMEVAYNGDGETNVEWSDVIGYAIDPALNIPGDAERAGGAETTNASPLLVNSKNTWSLRPNAYTRIFNFYLASDFVRTNTDLATMEAANEAAKRAVNAVLAFDHRERFSCEIYPLSEPWLFNRIKKWDQERFEAGFPWMMDFEDAAGSFFWSPLRSIMSTVSEPLLDEMLIKSTPGATAARLRDFESRRRWD